MDNILLSILNVFLLYFVLTNALPERLKIFPSLCIMGHLFFWYILFSKLGHIITYPGVGGALILIFAFSSAKIINVSCAVLVYLFNIALNHILLYGLFSITGISTYDLYATKSYGFVFQSIYLVIIILLTQLFSWLFQSKLKILEINFNKKLTGTVLLNLIVGAILFVFHFSYAEKIRYPENITKMNTILFSAYFIFSFISSMTMVQIQRQENKLQLKLERQEQLEDYLHTLELIQHDMRIFRHDYQNILSTLNGYILENDMNGLKDWFQNSIIPFSAEAIPQTFTVGNLSNIEILEIKGLLYTKIISALAEGIALNINIPYPVTETKIDHLDFSKLLGIFLDNAIEATVICDVKRIDITILQENTLSLSILNTCMPINIPLSHLTALNATTKGNGHGHGLYEANKILKKYPYIYHCYSYKNNIFEQYLDNI